MKNRSSVNISGKLCTDSLGNVKLSVNERDEILDVKIAGCLLIGGVFSSLGILINFRKNITQFFMKHFYRQKIVLDDYFVSKFEERSDSGNKLSFRIATKNGSSIDWDHAISEIEKIVPPCASHPHISKINFSTMEYIILVPPEILHNRRLNIISKSISIFSLALTLITASEVLLLFAALRERQIK